MKALSRGELSKLYSKRAKHYDFTANLYYLIGFREWAYRRRAVEALNLHRGDTVVEIGCGTGLNFSLLQEAVGPEGKIIGVDLTEAMLAQAQRKVEEKGWSNVELVQSDAVSYQFPVGVDGIISTFAISLVPEFDKVIQNGSEALSPGKRWVILDLKIPSSRLSYLTPLLIPLVRPFGATMEVVARQPWESINKYLQKTSLTELYMGMAYIAVGKAGVESLATGGRTAMVSETTWEHHEVKTPLGCEVRKEN